MGIWLMYCILKLSPLITQLVNFLCVLCITLNHLNSELGSIEEVHRTTFKLIR